MKKQYDKPLTAEELAVLPDSEIDYSDIPELDEDFWMRAKIAQPRTKPNISLRIPQEVLEFFKAENPKGYTARMVAVLGAYAQAHQKK